MFQACSYVGWLSDSGRLEPYLTWINLSITLDRAGMLLPNEINLDKNSIADYWCI